MATTTPAFTIADTPDAQVLDVTSEMFFQMIEVGVFPRECCVFLWAGRLYERMTKTVDHCITVYKIQEKLRGLITLEWLIWCENPVALDDKHAPLPDVMLVRGPLERYEKENRHPRAADVGLIVEIAVSGLTHDLNARAEKFARALVPNYWVADVQGHCLIEHTAPQIVDGVGSYARVQPRGLGDEIHLELDGRVVPAILVADLIW